MLAGRPLAMFASDLAIGVRTVDPRVSVRGKGIELDSPSNSQEVL